MQQGIYDEFVAALTEAAKDTRTGYDPDDEDILYGPINNANQLGHVSGLVERAPDHARVTTGGHRVGDRGFFYEPTIVADLQPGRRADPDRDLRAGPHRAEVHRRGRGAAARRTTASTAWRPRCGPSNVNTAARMAARLDFGCVWVNTHIPLIAEMPHGGFKHSGYGKDLSMYGLEDYTRIKHVMLHHGFEG